jgi:hypothetical protein
MTMTTPSLPRTDEEFTVMRTELPGGAWMMEWRNTQGTTLLAFTTLDNARRYIAQVTNVDKRVRMTKHSDAYYTYRHRP